jgi:hypothetical protein
MTEERKVQLGVAVDASGAKEGFEQVKADARAMAQVVGQAGQTAGKGIDAIGEGAKRNADSFTREEGRIRASIQRATLDLKTLGKSASEKLEAKIELQGLDAAKFAPYLAALKQAEAAQKSLQESSAATGAAIQRAGMTWNEFTGQRMGPVMKDFTDQGLPHKEAHTAAIRQIGQEWQQYKAAGVAAQTAVATQTAATTAALTAEAGALSRVTTSLGASTFVNFDKVTTSLGAAAVNADAATRAVQRLDKAIELTGPLATAGTSFGASVGPATGGLRGAIERRGAEDAARGIDPRLAALTGSAASTAPYVAGLRAAEKAQGDLGLSSKQLTFALRQVPMQMTDIVTSLAAGQRPFQVLIQQGGQLKDLFGGIGPAARALGTYALGLVNPFTVAAAAVVGLGVAMAHAESAARGLNTLQAQLAGTGRAGMFSDTGLKEFIAELALAPGVTRESATAIVSELSKVHQIGGGIFKDLGNLAVDYAKATGTDAVTAAKTLAKALADPEKGAKQLDEALGTLSSSTILTVERLSKMGDIAGAQRVLIDALKGSVKGLADNGTTPLQESVTNLGNAWEGAMRKMDQSDGLRNLNALLGQTVKLVTFLVNNADKVGNGGATIFGLGAPAAAANAAVTGARALFGETPKNPTAKGRVSDVSGTPAGAVGTVGASTAEAELKRAQEAAKSYRGQAGELADLRLERQRFNAALDQSIAKYGKESEQAKLFRQAIAGVDEKVASVKKRGAGGSNNEPQQVLDAKLQQSVSATRDTLAQERDAIAFTQRFLQGVYQAGEISLRDFYDEKRKAIERGTAAELAALAKERADVEQHLADTKRTSPKDKSALEKDQTLLNQIDAKAEKVRIDGAREQVSANQEATASFKALDEQVLQYQASLKSLQGDEIGAARIRDEIARKQLAVLALQSKGSATPITDEDQRKFAAAQQQNSTLSAARTDTGFVNQRLQLAEDRIALSVRSGATGEIEALGQLGDARAKAVAELEKIVKAQEEVAASRPKDYQLQIDTSRARLELDKLKAELDPLKEKFDNLFKDAGASALEKLGQGKPKEALKGFFADISRELNAISSKAVSEQIFGKGGPLGGLGGMFSDLFGGKKKTPLGESAGVPDDIRGAFDPAKPVLDTSGVTTSLNTMTTAGVDPATAALGRFQAALDGAAATVGSTTSQPLPVGSPLPPVADGTGSTGDFARFDRRQTGEAAVMGMFKEAEKSGAQLAGVNDKAANSILQFASAAARGGDAMSMLPSIINMIQAAAAAMSAGGGGGGGGAGGLFGSLGSLFGGGGGGTFTGTTGLEGMSPDTLALFFHSGGIVGKDKDARPVPRGVFADAGKYHGGGVVSAVRADKDQPKLAANEVPAILMGGPKGSREEVLHASDPRHADNLSPAVLKVLQSAPNKLPALLSAPVAAQRAAAASSTSSSERSTTVRERTEIERQTPALFKAVQGAPGVPGRAFALSVVAGVGGPGGRGGDSRSFSRGGDAIAIGGRGGDSFARAQGGAGGDAKAIAVEAAQRVPGVNLIGGPATGAGPAPSAGTSIVIVPTVTSERTARELRESVLRESRYSTTNLSTTTASVLRQAGAPGGKGGDGGPGALANVDVSVTPSVLSPRAAPRTTGEVAVRGPAAAERAPALVSLDLRALAGPMFHAGGIVTAGAAAPLAAGKGELKLAANEVPAILMGGPKGKREEVLHADDPRHRDRLTPAMAKLFDAAPRYHTGGLVGLRPDDRSSFARPATAKSGGESARGVTNHYTVQVTAGSGVTREQAMNQGREIQRGMQVQVGRRTRNT